VPSGWDRYGETEGEGKELRREIEEGD